MSSPKRVAGTEDLMQFFCVECGGTALITFDEWSYHGGHPAGWGELYEYQDSHGKTEPSGKYKCAYCRAQGE